MLVKVTTKVLVDSVGSFNKLMNADVRASVSLQIRKNSQALQKVFEPFNAVRKILFEKYGEEVNGQQIIKDEHMEVFLSELKTLTDVEEEVELALIDFANIANTALSAMDLNNLEYMLKFE